MCNSLVLFYQCGHGRSAKGVARCNTAIDNERQCNPQQKIQHEPGRCSDCTIRSEKQRLQQSIHQTRQNCIRLGATPAQMASIQPTQEQLKSSGRDRGSMRYEEDSGYGSESTCGSASLYSGSQGHPANQWRGSGSIGHYGSSRSSSSYNGDYREGGSVYRSVDKSRGW